MKHASIDEVDRGSSIFSFYGCLSRCLLVKRLSYWSGFLAEFDTLYYLRTRARWRPIVES